MTVVRSLFCRASGERRKLSWRKRLAFSAGTAVLAIVVMEGLAYLTIRWALGCSLADLHEEQASLAQAYGDAGGGRVTIHPYLGWVLNPETNPGSTIEGRNVPVNSLGFGDFDHGIPKRRPGRYVVAILGGSVAWQMSVFGEKALRDRLRRDSRFREGEIEIVRLAMSGYKQPQQLLSLAWLLSLGAEFDAVVNIDGYNEIALPICENNESGVFLAYPRMWNRWMLEVVDPRVYSMSYRVLQARAMRQELAQKMRVSPFCWSPTWNLVWYVRNRRWGRELVEIGYELSQAQHKTGFGFASRGPREQHADEDAVLARCVALWKDSSVQIDALCRSQQIPYVHVLQPNQYFSGSKPMSDEEAGLCIISDQEYGQSVARGYPLLVREGESLRARGIAFHDLTMLFSTVHEPIYVDPFCHYNARGSRQLAEAVADCLLEALGMAPASHSD